MPPNSEKQLDPPPPPAHFHWISPPPPLLPPPAHAAGVGAGPEPNTPPPAHRGSSTGTCPGATTSTTLSTRHRISVLGPPTAVLREPQQDPRQQPNPQKRLPSFFASHFACAQAIGGHTASASLSAPVSGGTPAVTPTPTRMPLVWRALWTVRSPQITAVQCRGASLCTPPALCTRARALACGGPGYGCASCSAYETGGGRGMRAKKRLRT